MYNTGHLGIASLSSVMYTIRFWLGSHCFSLRAYLGIQTDPPPCTVTWGLRPSSKVM